jgi:uncharacterized membrane protein
MFMFFGYFIVEHSSGPIVALKESARITKGEKWNIFLLVLIFLGINILGVLALGIGLLITAPMSAIGIAYVYRKLSAAQEVSPAA